MLVVAITSVKSASATASPESMACARLGIVAAVARALAHALTCGSHTLVQILSAVVHSCGTSSSHSSTAVCGPGYFELVVRHAEYDIASRYMVSFYCFVTKACVRRPGAAASVERRRRER